MQAAPAIHRPADVVDLLANYTPSIAPRRDGSHLVLMWFNMENQALFRR